jgi:hypothetical protein
VIPFISFSMLPPFSILLDPEVLLLPSQECLLAGWLPPR